MDIFFIETKFYEGEVLNFENDLWIIRNIYYITKQSTFSNIFYLIELNNDIILVKEEILKKYSETTNIFPIRSFNNFHLRNDYYNKLIQNIETYDKIHESCYSKIIKNNKENNKIITCFFKQLNPYLEMLNWKIYYGTDGIEKYYINDKKKLVSKEKPKYQLDSDSFNIPNFNEMDLLTEYEKTHKPGFYDSSIYDLDTYLDTNSKYNSNRLKEINDKRKNELTFNLFINKLRSMGLDIIVEKIYDFVEPSINLNIGDIVLSKVYGAKNITFIDNTLNSLRNPFNNRVYMIITDIYLVINNGTRNYKYLCETVKSNNTKSYSAFFNFSGLERLYMGNIFYFHNLRGTYQKNIKTDIYIKPTPINKLYSIDEDKKLKIYKIYEIRENTFYKTLNKKNNKLKEFLFEKRNIYPVKKKYINEFQ